MNCYYSNLIEGHNTLPIDIERALAGDFAQDKNKQIASSKPAPTSRSSG